LNALPIDDVFIFFTGVSVEDNKSRLPNREQRDNQQQQNEGGHATCGGQRASAYRRGRARSIISLAVIACSSGMPRHRRPAAGLTAGGSYMAYATTMS
jgi:hypothetical protein